MRGRVIVVVLILGLLVVGVWEGRKFFSPPVPLPPPVVETPVTPPAPTPVPVQAHPQAAPVQKAPPAPVSRTVPKPQAPPKPRTLPQPTAPNVPPQPVVPVRRVLPPPPPPHEWKGNSDTSITHPGQIVVKNEQQWNHFWAEHHPHEVSPDVDFSQKMVVGVFLGERPADQFSVEIIGARVLPKAVVVDYVERAPPPGTFQMSVSAFPYAIKAVPRSTLPVKFNKLTAQYLPDTSLIQSSGTKP